MFLLFNNSFSEIFLLTGCVGYLTWDVWCFFLEHQQQQKAGASGDVQEFGPDGKPITKRNFSMDAALEDKICDLYDIFVDVRLELQILIVKFLLCAIKIIEPCLQWL